MFHVLLNLKHLAALTLSGPSEPLSEGRLGKIIIFIAECIPFAALMRARQW
jgi:hypothetical protein